MNDFAQLYKKLDSSNKTRDKISALINYFNEASESDILWVIYLLSGGKITKYVTSTQLKKWAYETLDMPEWLFKECYTIVGDSSETMALLFETFKDVPPSEEKNIKDEKSELSDVQSWVDYLASMKDDDDARKKEKIVHAWKSFSLEERFVFNKLLSRSYRVGVSKQTVINALSKYTGIEPSVLSNRLIGNWHPTEVSFEDLVLKDSEEDRLSRPYPFALAYSLESAFFENERPIDWIAEWKFDGIRCQLIKRKGEVTLWSRGEEIITDSFPDIVDAAERCLPDGIALDAEIIVYNHGVKSFNDLQQRLGRKKVSTKLMKNYPVKLVVYDLFEIKGTDIRDESLQKRVEQLNKIIPKVLNIKVDGNNECFLRSPVVNFSNWEELAHLREQAREFKVEGFMLKKKDSAYFVGRKKGYWYKWKVDPFSIDAVLLYAQRGSGRRANLYTDYTLAVWKDEDTLVPIAKAYSGLTDMELKEMNKWILQHTIDTFGPVRSVQAKQVFEIGFEGLQKSTRHKSGISLRFPRILRWRKDKPAGEADSLDTVQRILREYEA